MEIIVFIAWFTGAVILGICLMVDGDAEEPVNWLRVIFWPIKLGKFLLNKETWREF